MVGGICMSCGSCHTKRSLTKTMKWCFSVTVTNVANTGLNETMTLRSKSGRRWLGCGIILIIISLFSYGVTSSSAVPYMTNCSLKHWNDLETYAITNCLFPHPIFWWLWQLIYLVPGVLFLYRGIKVNRNNKRVKESGL